MYNVQQERMMTSVFLGRKEEECVIAKNLKQAESFVCTKNRTHLHISLQFHISRLRNSVLFQQDVTAPSLPGGL